MKNSLAIFMLLILMNAMQFQLYSMEEVRLNNGLVYPKETVKRIMNTIQNLLLFDYDSIALNYLIDLCFGIIEHLDSRSLSILRENKLIDDQGKILWTVENIIKSWVYKKDKNGYWVFHSSPYPKSMLSKAKSFIWSS